MRRVAHIGLVVILAGSYLLLSSSLLLQSMFPVGIGGGAEKKSVVAETGKTKEIPQPRITQRRFVPSVKLPTLDDPLPSLCFYPAPPEPAAATAAVPGGHERPLSLLHSSPDRAPPVS